MKRIIYLLLIAVLVLVTLETYSSDTVRVFANDKTAVTTVKAKSEEKETKKENETVDQTRSVSNVNLTVVIPEQEQKEETKAEKPTEPPKETQPVKQAPVIPKLYPVNVIETEENGLRQIIKTYELGEQESPSDILRDSFEINGWHYELTDIIKKETASGSAREHKKTVELATDTKDMPAIIKLLAPTIEYNSEDGYQGILSLDINSIVVETAKTKKSTFPISVTREYPNLSSNDASFVPKTISDNGRTLALSSVSWKTSTTNTTDYNQLPNSYTAIATYSTTGSKTTVTGYVVKADYNGTISKLVKGKTAYNAIFQGLKMKPKLLPMIEQETISSLEEEATQRVEEAKEKKEEINNTDRQETKQIENATPTSKYSSFEFFIMAFLAFSVILSLLSSCYVFLQYKDMLLKKEEIKTENESTKEDSTKKGEDSI